MKGDVWFFLLNEELETQEFSRNNLTEKQVQKGFEEQLRIHKKWMLRF